MGAADSAYITDMLGDGVVSVVDGGGATACSFALARSLLPPAFGGNRLHGSSVPNTEQLRASIGPSLEDAIYIKGRYLDHGVYAPRTSHTSVKGATEVTRPLRDDSFATDDTSGC